MQRRLWHQGKHVKVDKAGGEIALTPMRRQPAMMALSAALAAPPLAYVIWSGTRLHVHGWILLAACIAVAAIAGWQAVTPFEQHLRIFPTRGLIETSGPWGLRKRRFELRPDLLGIDTTSIGPSDVDNMTVLEPDGTRWVFFGVARRVDDDPVGTRVPERFETGLRRIIAGDTGGWDALQAALWTLPSGLSAWTFLILTLPVGSTLFAWWSLA